VIWALAKAASMAAAMLGHCPAIAADDTIKKKVADAIAEMRIICGFSLSSYASTTLKRWRLFLL
jgi:predicted esterase YcpF (UPF0227 family)